MPSTLLRYGGAVAASTLALLLTLLLRPLVEPTIFPLFLGAVGFSAWHGGLGPGLLAALLSTLAGTCFFLLPLYSLGLDAPGTGYRLGTFVLGAVVISVLGEVVRKGRSELETRVHQRTAELATANAALQSEVAERRRAEAALRKAQCESETRVEERTAELAKANEALQIGIVEHQRADAERARLLAREQAARADAEAASGVLREVNEQLAVAAVREQELAEQAEIAQHRFAFLAEASQALAASLDHETTLTNLARLAVPFLADWCIVDVVEDDQSIRRLAVANVDPSKEALARAVQRYPPDPNVAGRVVNVLRTGRSEIFAEAPDELLTAVARDAEHLRILRALAYRFAMIVPLTARGQTLGAISLVSAESARRYGPTDLALAEELARRAAVAVDNARLYRQVQQALCLREQFLTALSHELRTPATVLVGSVQVLQRQGPRNERERRALARIREAAERTSRLARTLVETDQLARGGLCLHRAPADLLEVVLARVRAAQLTAEQHRFQVCAAGPTAVEADRDRLALVVSALLENAVKYQPGGGIVRVTVAAEGDDAVVRVHDFGVGIPPDRLPNIFEPLFEPWPPGSPYYVGLVGLDLYLARSIVEAHGGRIRAESRAGQGSTIAFCLPLVARNVPDLTS